MTQNQTSRAFLAVDVQRDFIEGGALAVTGGYRTSVAIRQYLARVGGDYRLLLASLDWHKPADESDNCGHFALDGNPDFVTSWPVHCEANTYGADFAPALGFIGWDYVVKKGYGTQSYSAFEGTSGGTSLLALLRSNNITDLDVSGIATDYCVRATVLDALGTGFRVRVLADLVAGVAPESSTAALELMADKGAEIHFASLVS